MSEEINLKKPSALVFFSGGMDSWIHLDWAIRKWGQSNVEAMFIKFGHSYQDKELEAATILTDWAAVPLLELDLNLSGYEDMETHHLMLRNVFMLLMGSYFADNLVFGMLENEISEDKNPSFVRLMQKLLDSQYKENWHHGERKVKIWTPYSHCTKTEMLADYLKKGGDRRAVEKTIGCYNTEIGQCGNCLSCFNRWVALTNNEMCEGYNHSPLSFWSQTLRKGSGGKMSPLLLWKKRRYIMEIASAMRKDGVTNPYGWMWDRAVNK